MYISVTNPSETECKAKFVSLSLSSQNPDIRSNEIVAFRQNPQNRALVTIATPSMETLIILTQNVVPKNPNPNPSAGKANI